MRNYVHENVARYREMASMGVRAWAEKWYGGADYAGFSSRGFLEEIIPRLRLAADRPRALELGTGVGPGALFLAERGFDVHAIDVIPEAIEQARVLASERRLQVRFEVMDATRIAHDGPAYDLVVDSYCLQGIVLDEDRRALFSAVKARLDARGYYLVSTAVYERGRHQSDRRVVDREGGRAFDRYDARCLYEPSTDVYYQPDAGGTPIDGAITVNGHRFVPFRRYRTGARLRAEVESYGLAVIHQSGALQENLVAVHRGSRVRL